MESFEQWLNNVYQESGTHPLTKYILKEICELSGHLVDLCSALSFGFICSVPLFQWCVQGRGHTGTRPS